MSESDLIEFISNRLTFNGLKPMRLTREQYPKRQIPDFRVNYEKRMLFMEIKQPELAPQFFLHDTKMNKLSKHLHTARKQFDSVNSLHLAPNVLVWVSEDMRLHAKNFREFMEGVMKNPDGSIMNDYRNSDFYKRNKADWSKIDLHLWLDMKNGKILQRFSFVNIDLNLITSGVLAKLELSFAPSK